MHVTSDFHHPRFVQLIESALVDKTMVIPHNLLMRMGLFFRRFVLTHEEIPENINGELGYYRQHMFAHRGICYALHYALLLKEPTPLIQIKLYTGGRCAADITFPIDTCLTLTARPTLPLTCVDSTIESLIRDITQYYFRLKRSHEVVDTAVRRCCAQQYSQFRNHINGKVRLTYYGDQFVLRDPMLMLTREFRLPQMYGTLIKPTLRDYLTLPPCTSFNFEPTFNNADVHKVVGDKEELIQFIYGDFRFKTRLDTLLKTLLTSNSTTFKETTTIRVGSYDRPVITLIRIKPTSYKKIHYIINNNIIKSLIND